MHAFLFIGRLDGDIGSNREVTALAKKLGAKTLDYPLKKIEDTRELTNLIRLSFNEPTLIILRDIEEATEEALNAFLKNLEEPQDNVYFLLTSISIQKVLPTIVSRCQIIKSANNKGEEGSDLEETEKFLKMVVDEELSYIDKIKDREKAVELVENTVNLLHSKLHQDRVKYSQIMSGIEVANLTLTRLKGNGNVGLQLTNFVINYD